MLKRELEEIVAQGEGYYTEFKRNVNGDFKKEMVAFANASGGRIFLGVDDDGTICGINITNELRSVVQQHANDCDPAIDITMEVVNGEVLIVNVPEARQKPTRSTNGFYLRVGPNSQKMDTAKITEYVERYGRVRFDERIRKDLHFNGSVSNELVDKFIALAGIENKFQNRNHILQSLGVLKQENGHNYLTNAGILFFTNDPSPLLPQASITCVAYNGTEKVDILDRKDFPLDLITSIESGLAFLRRHLNEASNIKGLQREEKLEIPLVALREALVNAVAHRDYLETGARVMVEIFSDRVIISNPGGLPAGLSEQDFGKYSLSRNPVISSLLLRAKLIEKLGTGVNRIITLLRRANLRAPEFSFNNFFSVTFWRPAKDVYKTIADRGEKSGKKDSEKGGKKSSEKSGKKSSEKSGKENNRKHAAIVDRGITKRQLQVLNLIIDNPRITYKEAAQKLKINDSAVQKHFDNLKKQHLIKRIGPDKGGYWKVNI